MTEKRINPGNPQSIYAQLGGDSAIQQLVRVFYEKVESKLKTQPLLLLHLRGNGLAHARVEQVNFLTGFLVGPKLYSEKHGHSNVKTLHTNVIINQNTKKIWLECMDESLSDFGVEAHLKQNLMLSFSSVAEMLVNQETPFVTPSHG
jgi:hemoglobin